MKTALKAVLFDMDGVLIDSAAVATRLLASAAARHGAHLSDEELTGLAGASGLQFWTYVKEAHGLPGRVEDYRESYDAEAEVAAYDASLVANGVHALIAALVASGVRVGVVTSGSCWRTGQVVQLVGVAELISVRVCADDVEYHKPDPAPYVVAAERLELSPSNCLAVEDSVRGVQSALAAGFSVAAYVGFDENRDAVSHAHGLIRDFRLETPTTLVALHHRAQD